uniref:Reverse transcriptase domain-containing protein n=1 Tax=Aegilops tauschii subsp. strangulata TaxID=200361 RepID=A0A453QLB1_AEGTS
MQKSHENWLLKGDRNTDYFHRIVNGRRRRNTIFSLSCGDEMIEGTKNLLNHATKFYKDLFGPASGNLCKLKEDMSESNEKLTDIDNFILTRPFSETEIKNALFSMKPNKAPGPDNIPIEFFQHCWEIVKSEVMLLFEWFHDNKLDVQRLNYGIITLLPKVAG